MQMGKGLFCCLLVPDLETSHNTLVVVRQRLASPNCSGELCDDPAHLNESDIVGSRAVGRPIGLQPRQRPLGPGKGLGAAVRIQRWQLGHHRPGLIPNNKQIVLRVVSCEFHAHPKWTPILAPTCELGSGTFGRRAIMR